jgi:hypothetical protein
MTPIPPDNAIAAMIVMTVLAVGAVMLVEWLTRVLQ